MAATRDLFAGVLPFLHTAESKSFREAARRLGVSPAAISKSVARLETELGVRLLNRTSRHVSLTVEGEQFLERCRAAVDSMEAGREAVTQSQRVPRGRLTVSLPHVLGRVIVPDLVRFAERHPRLSLQLRFTDHFSDMIGEGVDVAIRIGELEASTLIAKHLTVPRWITVASPAYLARRGTPEEPADLTSHDCLRFLAPGGRPRDWMMAEQPGGTPRRIAIDGPLVVDHGEMLLEAAASGLGICQVFDFMARDPVRDGRLIEVLPRHATDAPPIRALCLPGRQSSPKVRAFFRFAREVFAGGGRPAFP